VSDTRQAGNFIDDVEGLPSDLLPMPHLTATTVLGGTVPERDMVAQLLATQIGSAITTRDPQEGRMLVVGTGLQRAELGRDEFMGLVDLALGVL
jgi:proteasome assembly chaperone 3